MAGPGSIDWTKGDPLTASKLNRMSSGIRQANGYTVNGESYVGPGGQSAIPRNIFTSPLVPFSYSRDQEDGEVTIRKGYIEQHEPQSGSGGTYYEVAETTVSLSVGINVVYCKYEIYTGGTIAVATGANVAAALNAMPEDGSNLTIPLFAFERVDSGGLKRVILQESGVFNVGNIKIVPIFARA